MGSSRVMGWLPPDDCVRVILLFLRTGDVFALEVVLCLNGNQQLLPITPRARRLFHRNTLSISQVNCGEWFGALAEHAVDAVKNFLPDIPRDKIMFCFTDANGET